MSVINLMLGVIGLLLAGASFEKYRREGARTAFAIGGVELLAGLFFIIAAIGSAS